ncbi:unnamed protein product [Moneuplotes crassus]|uniref:Uncharacterized protein n=1 Tax=Euplotes crassus TaxID=5936 RepID=A0AAD1XWI7_EUPCR|nr:unnamed protein product [Moneuplotes crassus]
MADKLTPLLGDEYNSIESSMHMTSNNSIKFNTQGIKGSQSSLQICSDSENSLEEPTEVLQKPFNTVYSDIKMERIKTDEKGDTFKNTRALYNLLEFSGSKPSRLKLPEKSRKDDFVELQQSKKIKIQEFSETQSLSKKESPSIESLKPKSINRSLVHLRVQHFSTGINQYRQTSYNEWIDYFSKSYLIKSQPIKDPDFVEEPNQKAISSSSSLPVPIKGQNSLKTTGNLPEKFLRTLMKPPRDIDSRSDSDMSFEFEKTKTNHQPLYKNNLKEEVKTESLIIFNEETDTPEPNSKPDASPENQDKIFGGTSSIIDSTQEFYLKTEDEDEKEDIILQSNSLSQEILKAQIQSPLQSTTSIQLNWENYTITEHENETTSKENTATISKITSNDFQTQTEQLLEPREVSSYVEKEINTMDWRQEMHDVSLDALPLPECQQCTHIDKLQSTIKILEEEKTSLEKNICELTDKITSLELDLQANKIGKKYSALMKIFEECQNTWKKENDNLRKLLLGDGSIPDNNSREPLLIISLKDIKSIVQDVMKESDQINPDTIKDSAYSSLSLSLTCAYKAKGTNASSLKYPSDQNSKQNDGIDSADKDASKNTEQNILSEKNIDNEYNTPRNEEDKSNFETTPASKSRSKSFLLFNDESVHKGILQKPQDLEKLVHSPQSIKKILNSGSDQHCNLQNNDIARNLDFMSFNRNESGWGVNQRIKYSPPRANLRDKNLDLNIPKISQSESCRSLHYGLSKFIDKKDYSKKIKTRNHARKGSIGERAGYLCSEQRTRPNKTPENREQWFIQQLRKYGNPKGDIENLGQVQTKRSHYRNSSNPFSFNNYTESVSSNMKYSDKHLQKLKSQKFPQKLPKQTCKKQSKHKISKKGLKSECANQDCKPGKKLKMYLNPI